MSDNMIYEDDERIYVVCDGSTEEGWREILRDCEELGVRVGDTSKHKFVEIYTNLEHKFTVGNTGGLEIMKSNGEIKGNYNNDTRERVREGKVWEYGRDIREVE